MRTVQNCGDIRGGYSGYWVLEVAEGPQRGSRVIAHYGDGAGVGMIGTGWHLAKSVQLGPTSPRGGWPNHCTQLGAVSYAGVVSELVAFDDDASARRALQAKRC